MKLKFMEQLDKAVQSGINVCDLIIANEVKCLTFLKGEAFEEVCMAAEKAYLEDEGEHEVEDIVKTAFYLFRIAKKQGIHFECNPSDILERMDEGVSWYDSAVMDEIYDLEAGLPEKNIEASLPEKGDE